MWVKDLPHPRCGIERHYLMATVHIKVTVDMSSGKIAHDGGEMMCVIPKYSADQVFVRPHQCLHSMPEAQKARRRQKWALPAAKREARPGGHKQ